MERIGIGRTAEVYLGQDGSAIKLFYPWVSPAQVEYEASVSGQVSRLYDHVPGFLGSCIIDGRLGLSYQRLTGVTLSAMMGKKPMKLLHFARLMAEMHRDIHSNSVAGFHTTADVYGDKLSNFDCKSDVVKNRLQALVQNGQCKALCHGDYHPENILMDSSGKAYVIDWNMAYSGDPLSDVARTHYLLRHGVAPGKKPLPSRMAEYLLKPVIAHTYLKTYFRGRPVPLAELNLWQLVIQICRYSHGIAEEQPLLKKSIAKMLKEQLKQNI